MSKKIFGSQHIDRLQILTTNSGFQPFFRNKFPGLFEDFSMTQIDFSRPLKFTLTPTLQRSQCSFSLLPSIHFIIFSWVKQISRTFQDQWPFPGLSSPGKCHNNIQGLSRFSKIRTNSTNLITNFHLQWHCTGLLIFRTVAEPRISSKSTKFTKTRKIPQNLLEMLPNTCQHNIFESYLGCWGCLLAVNLLIYLETSSPQRVHCKQHPKTTRRS